MNSKIQKHEYFNEGGHLNPESAAIWVDALVKKDVDSVPEQIRRHLEDCMMCKQEVIDLYEDVYGRNTATDPERKNHPELPIPKLSRRLRWTSIAASILIFMAIAFLLSIIFKAPSNHRLFSEYFVPYQDIVTVKGSKNTLAGKAMHHYNLKQYDSAVLIFNAILTNDSADIEARFYRANSLLASDQPDEAIKAFEELYQLNPLSYKPMAKWYLALAYLKAGEISGATAILNQIVQDSSSYRDKASELLFKLK